MTAIETIVLPKGFRAEQMATVSTLRMHGVSQRLTIKVTGLRGLLLRMWVGGLIFRFGAAVAGTKLEIDVS